MIRSTSNSTVIGKKLIFIFAITLLAVMGVASIAPAFPQIQEHFNLNKQEVAYLVVAFTFSGIFLTPFAGILADRVGRKAVLIPSILLFGIAGFLCVFAPDFHSLLVLRFFQGLGAASLGSLNITLVGDMFEGNKRATAMGYNASVLSLGTSVFPFIGGSLAMISWNYVFILPVLAIPVGIIAIFYFHPPRIENKQKFDVYLTNLKRAFSKKKVLGVIIMTILLFFLIYGAMITYLPSLLKERFNSNAFQNGLTLSLMSLTAAITSTQTGIINKWFRQKKILIIGTIFYIFSMLGIAYANSWWAIAIPIFFFGIGQGFFIPTVQTLLVGFASAKERAAFMSLNGMVLRTGQTIGPAVIGLAYAYGGISWVYLGGAIVAFLMLLSAMIFIDTR